MPRYLPQRERVVRLDRRRGHALLEYVIQLANGGDDRAASFLDAVAAGAYGFRAMLRCQFASARLR
jgi:hypothetical protein